MRGVAIHRSSGIVLVTGATGFVGRALVPALAASGLCVRACVRAGASARFEAAEITQIGDLRGSLDWTPALRDVDAVVHLAGVAHTAGVTAEEYDLVNNRATAALGHAAAQAGVHRLVFVSSILAQTATSASKTITEDAVPAPHGGYGASKLAAEEALAQLALEWVVLRPVLVYGPGVQGNMAQLLRLARLPLPLPFKAIHNRRSLLAIEDLVAAVCVALESPKAARETFLVADDAPLSLEAMITAMRAGVGRRPGLFEVPPSALQAAANLVGQRSAWERAAGDLVASNRKMRALGWSPTIDTHAGLAKLAAAARPGSWSTP